MKRIIALSCAVLLVCFSLCSCMNGTADTIKEKASEALSDLQQDMTDYSNDNQGLLDDNRETWNATETVEDTTDGIYTEEGNMETMWDDMVENGEVEDGDGNVGELENSDGDSNIDTDAVD